MPEHLSSFPSNGAGRHRKKDAANINVEISCDPILWMNKLACLVSARDVTDQVRLNEAIRKSEKRLRNVFAHAAIGFAIKGTDGRLKTVNHAYCKITGYTRKELYRMDFRDLTHPDDVPSNLEYLRRISTGEINSFVHQKRYVTKSGETIRVQNSVSAIRDSAGILTGFTVLIEDIHERMAMEAELKAQAALLDLAHDAIIVRDLQSRIIFWNEGARKIYGWKKEDATGRVSHELLQTIFAVPLEAVESALLEQNVWEGELQHVTSDGKRIVVLSRWSLARDARGSPKTILEINRDITERKCAEVELRRVSSRLLRAQDGERRSIARNLHDSTGQDLAALAALLKQLYHSIPSLKRKASQLLSQCQDLSNRCVREVRTLSYVLHPPMLDEAGLEDALHHYLDGFAKRSGIRVKLVVSPSFGRLTPEVELALFRVTQECLSNIQRHSGSLHASIRLDRLPDGFTLEVNDKGRGSFDNKLKRNGMVRFEAGIGIQSMQERVKLIGGRLDIDSGSNGTTVRVTLPVVGEKHEYAPHPNS